MSEAVLQSIRMATGSIQEEQRQLLANLGLSVKGIGYDFKVPETTFDSIKNEHEQKRCRDDNQYIGRIT